MIELMVGAGRPYNSARREAQASQTRQDILDAAQRQFTRVGFAATTMAAVAGEAGVAPATVYVTFKNKRALLDAVRDRLLAGAPDVTPDVERPDWDSLEPRARMALGAARARDVHQRSAPLMDIAAAADPDLAALMAEFGQRRREATRQYVEAFAAEGVLKPDLDVQTAIDICWTLNGPQVYTLLVKECGWSPDRYVEWTAATLCTLLLDLPDDS